MKDILLYSFFLLVGIRLVKSGQTVGNTLQCYQCHLPAQKNLDGVCNDVDKKICPDDFAADRCITTIRKNSTTQLYDITKKCALAPCEFKEMGTNNLFKLSDCDLTRKDAICSKCCEGDGCNFASGAFSITQRISGNPTFHIWATISLTIFLPVLTYDLELFLLERLK